MVEFYVPSINSQINKNFEVGFIINPIHISEIKFKLDVPVRYFDSKNDYLHKIESKIKIMQHHKTYGEQLFKQLQNIIVIFNYRYKHNTLHYLYKIIFI